MTAASLGDLEGVRKHHKYLLAQESHGWTALILAARGNHLDCVKELSAEHKLVDNENKTALIHAAAAGHDKIVEALISERGMEDMYGWTALMYAARKGSIPCLKLLRDEATKQSHKPHLGVGAGATALIIAASYGQVAALDLLGAIESSICDKNDRTMEWYAVSQDEKRFLDRIDENYTLVSDLNLEEVARDTPPPPPSAHAPPPPQEPAQDSTPKKPARNLLEAIQMNDHLAFREFLRPRSAVQSEGDENGMTPLMHAARLGRCSFIKYLRPDWLRKRDKKGWTALMHAIDANQKESMRLLLGECDMKIDEEDIQAYVTRKKYALADDFNKLTRSGSIVLPEKLSKYTATYRMSANNTEENWYAYDLYPRNHIIQKFKFDSLKAFTLASEKIPRLERFRHENILDYRDVAFSESDLAVYYVLDFYAGTLKDQFEDRASAKDTFSDVEVWNFIYSIAKGLDFLEEKGRIVHRNLTPSSIYIDKCGRFCIGDMTIARHLDEGQNLMSRCGMDELYHAPELHDGKSCDNKIDVWSLGVMAYQMCVGELPFKNVREAIDIEPQLITNRNENLVHLIMKMLSKNREERPSPVDITDTIDGHDVLPNDM